MPTKRIKQIRFSEAVFEDGDAMGPYIRYMRGRAVSQNTLNDYHNTFRLWLERMEDRELREISVEDVDTFLATMATEPIAADGAAPRPSGRRARKTIQNYRTALASLWTWAVNRGFADEHVVQATRAPRVHDKPISPLSRPDVVALVKATAETRAWHNKPLTTSRRSTAERDRCLILILYETMARISEAINLQVRDVETNRRGGQITIRDGKGQKTRVVPFGRQTAKAYREWMDVRGVVADREWVFINVLRNYGTQMSRDAAGRLVKRLGKKAGIQRAVTPHLLRGTGACHLSRDISPWDLQRRMGHSDIRTTMRYVRAAEAEETRLVVSPADQLQL